MTNKKLLIAAVILILGFAGLGYLAIPPSSDRADASYAGPGQFQPIISAGSSGQYFGWDLAWHDFVAPAAFSFNMTPSHSIVTTAAAANGWQLSATRNAMASYSFNITTTATIGGASDGYVVMEIATTNSVTASDWKEVARSRNGQTITLAIALNSVQNMGVQLMGIVPAGSYVRLRSINTSGTPVYTYISGEELLL